MTNSTVGCAVEATMSKCAIYKKLFKVLLDTENFNGVLAVSIKEIMYKTSKKVMVKCFGLMVQSIEVIGIKANKMGLVS